MFQVWTVVCFISFFEILIYPKLSYLLIFNVSLMLWTSQPAIPPSSPLRVDNFNDYDYSGDYLGDYSGHDDEWPKILDLNGNDITEQPVKVSQRKRPKRTRKQVVPFGAVLDNDISKHYSDEELAVQVAALEAFAALATGTESKRIISSSSSSSDESSSSSSSSSSRQTPGNEVNSRKLFVFFRILLQFITILYGLYHRI